MKNEVAYEQIESYCSDSYLKVFNRKYQELIEDAKSKGIDATEDSKSAEFEVIAQKEAIKLSTIDGLIAFPGISSAMVWSAVQKAHMLESLEFLILILLTK